MFMSLWSDGNELTMIWQNECCNRCGIGRALTEGWLGERLGADNRLRWRFLHFGDVYDKLEVRTAES